VLAPLNGTIAVGVDNISPTGESQITLWKWESGIPLPTSTTGAEETLQMNTLTNATTTAPPDTNATTTEEEAPTTPEEPLDILGQ
jgi:hypothetical protein